MSDTHRLFAELEATLTNGSGQQRFTILRKVTDLFLAQAETYSHDHVAVFDELMTRLIDRIERQALIELSGRLAPIDHAPVNVIGILSGNDDIAIAGPVLAQSGALGDEQLIEIAQSKSQAHLAAIAARARVNEQITDVLIDRGDAEVAHKVTANPGARFSRFGFDRAVSRAQDDDSLAVAVGSRVDLPDDLLEQLVSRASMTVQQKLLAQAPPEMRQRIDHVIATVSERVVRAEVPPGASMAPAMRRDPVRLRARITECAENGNLAEMVDALAVLSEISVSAIKDMARQGSDEAMLVLGKACGFGWHDLQRIMGVLAPSKRSPDEVNALFANYATLSPESAQRALRFISNSRSKFTNEMRKLVAAAS
jgi:hypothetical protein